MAGMTLTEHVSSPEIDASEDLPLLFGRREATVLDAKLGSTTACQTTAASDYTPDD